MTTNTYLLIFFLCFFSTIIFAQTPGYLGNRASLIINSSTFPAFKGPTINDKGTDSYGREFNGIGLNYEFEAVLSYAYKRYKSLGLIAGQYRTAQEFFTSTDPVDSSVEGQDEHRVFSEVNVNSISLIRKKFRRHKGGLAPFGNYFFLGLRANFVTGSILEKTTTYASSNGSDFGHQEILPDPKFTQFLFVYGFGNNLIFKDRIIFSMGMRFSLPFKPSTLATLSSGEAAGRDFEDKARFRLFYHEFFRINVGVGVLLF